MPVLVGIFTAQILHDAHLTDIGAQRIQSTPTGAADAETIWLRRPSQINDRQVLPAPMIAHIKANGSATVAGDRCVRRCAGRIARPSCARFVSRMLTRRQHIMIDLIRRLAVERRVRARLIEPFLKKRKFPVEHFTAKWHEDLRVHSFLRLRINRSMSAILPCWPTAPKRGVIPW